MGLWFSSVKLLKSNAALMFLDAALLSASVYLSLVTVNEDINAGRLLIFGLFVFLTICILAIGRVYNAIIGHTGRHTMVLIFILLFMSTVVLTLIVYSLLPFKNELIFIFAYFFISYILIAGSRVLLRFFLDSYRVKAKNIVEIVIYGAGIAGIQILSALKLENKYQPVCFIDDDVKLIGKVIGGLSIYGPDKLENLVKDNESIEVWVAIPSMSEIERNELLYRLGTYSNKIKLLPSLTDLSSNHVGLSDLKNIEIDDLLGRNVVPPIPELLEYCITDKSVLITGGGGSIGSELSVQALNLGPKKIILIDSSEFNLYSIEQKLLEKYDDVYIEETVVFLLCNVLDYGRVSKIINLYSVDTVYHAAAYKHVPLVESNPFEASKNNIIGTYNVAKSSIENNVSNFVLISTDKAVRPTNIMGASKRTAEIMVQLLASLIKNKSTKLCMVRFGNVLGSSGSVVPKFRKQIEAGGPVTVTHPDVIRYFMTIPEAAQLVMQAGSLADGGDIFILDMGEQVSIYGLAKRMIELSGNVVNESGGVHGGIDIEFTGLRPGEKLFEELLISKNDISTRHPKIRKAQDLVNEDLDINYLLKQLDSIISESDIDGLVDFFDRIVDGYVSSDKLKTLKL